MTVVLWVAVALILYSYAGYPLLLLLRAALQRRTDRDRRPFEPTVTMLIVAHNEESVIEAKLKNCLSLDYPKDRLEVLVASDGSSDRTEAIVAGFADRGVRLLSLPGPRGKPAALNRAVAEGHGEILVLCDARQTLAPDSIRELVQHFADPRVGAVSGELHLGEADGAGRGVDLYWKYEKLIRRTESQIDSTVGVTGALYALRKELFRPLDPRIILDDVAIPMDVVQAGLRVLFEPGARVFDRASNASDTEYRRKLRTLAGNYQLVFLEPWLLDPRRNRLWWQFVSHKDRKSVV